MKRHALGGARTALPFVLFAVLVSLIILKGSQYLITASTFSALYVMVAVGVCFMTYSGYSSFGQNFFFGLGGYASGILAVRWNLFPDLGPIFGIVAAALAALMLGSAIFRVRGMAGLVTTAAIGVGGYSLFSTAPIFGGYSGIYGIPPFRIGSVELTTNSDYLAIAAACILISLIGLSLAVSSGYGRTIMAIRDDEVAAEGFGINVHRHRAQIFAIAGGLAGLSGSLLAHWQGTANIDFYTIKVSLTILMITVIGGRCTIWGPVWGGIVYGILQYNSLPQLVGWSEAVLGIVFIVTLIFFPAGIASVFSRSARSQASERRKRGIAGFDFLRPKGAEERSAAGEY
jgi:branched-chain amino acid transport system permease protein